MVRSCTTMACVHVCLMSIDIHTGAQDAYRRIHASKNHRSHDVREVGTSGIKLLHCFLHLCQCPCTATNSKYLALAKRVSPPWLQKPPHILRIMKLHLLTVLEDSHISVLLSPLLTLANATTALLN